MDNADSSSPALNSDSGPLTEPLEELSEPLDPIMRTDEILSPGTILTSEDVEPITILRLLRDGVSRRLYEARQDEETLWLWEGTGESAPVLCAEAALLRQAHCPMLPRVQTTLTVGDRCYLATERCDGETLSELLTSGAVDLRRTLTVLSQIAFALTKLHGAGFVHLGLRPAVIVGGRPAKIVDFTDVTRIGEVPARAFYHAGFSPPELLRAEPADVRSDVYSMGAMLFHALNGKPIAETGVELMTWQPTNPVAGVPQILTRCLGEKETRYASASELHQDLVRLARRLTPPVRYALGAATSIGLEPTRTTNQDSYAVAHGSLVCEAGNQSWLMACVADGMGGMEAGEVASEAVVRSIEEQACRAFSTQGMQQPEVQARDVRKWVHGANEQVCAALERRRARGGSTVVCACLVGNRLAIAHVGDCRLYRFRGGDAELLTRDHSLAMTLVTQGEIDIGAVRNHPDRSAVTRSLGERAPMPDYFVDGLGQVTGGSTLHLEPGETLLLCSDGVWEPLEEEELIALLAANESDLNAAAEAIVEATLARGGEDNATAVLVRIR